MPAQKTSNALADCKVPDTHSSAPNSGYVLKNQITFTSTCCVYIHIMNIIINNLFIYYKICILYSLL